MSVAIHDAWTAPVSGYWQTLNPVRADSTHTASWPAQSPQTSQALFLEHNHIEAQIKSLAEKSGELEAEVLANTCMIRVVEATPATFFLLPRKGP